MIMVTGLTFQRLVQFQRLVGGIR